MKKPSKSSETVKEQIASYGVFETRLVWCLVFYGLAAITAGAVLQLMVETEWFVPPKFQTGVDNMSGLLFVSVGLGFLLTVFALNHFLPKCPSCSQPIPKSRHKDSFCGGCGHCFEKPIIKFNTKQPNDAYKQE